MRTFTQLLTGFLVAAFPLASAAAEPIFDWGTRNEGANGAAGLAVGYVPIPHIGHDYPATHDYYQNTWRNQTNSGGLVGLMLQTDCGPVDGITDVKGDHKLDLTNAMNWLAANNLPLNYVFSDFETGQYDANTLEMVRQVRNHANAQIRSAWVGQYAEFAGNTDNAAHFPHIVDRSARSQFYLDSGLNVSMPNCYPYSYFNQHVVAGLWGTNVAPNVRSALLWAPLERMSEAKRNLPAGHQLIPWISGMIAWDGYPVDAGNVPTAEDRVALLRHMRLRGADGYYNLETAQSGLTNEQFRAEMRNAWGSLDKFFALPGQATILNLQTSKKTGVQWSAVQKGGRTLVQVTNLGNSAATIAYPAGVAGLPASSPSLAAGSNRLLQYMAGTDTMDQAFQRGDHGLKLSAAGWKGANAASFALAAPTSSGNASSSVITSIGGSANTAWMEMANPGFTVDDRVIYSFKALGAQGAMVSPVMVDATVRANNTGGLVAADHQGPRVGFYQNQLQYSSRWDSGDIFQATNFTPDAMHWYEVQMLVDAAGATDLASVFVKDLTAGASAYTLVSFDNTVTSGTVETLTQLPLNLSSLANVSTFNGWMIHGAANTQFDDLAARLYVYGEGLYGGMDLGAIRSAEVPEPSVVSLLAIPVATLSLRRRRKTVLG